MLWGTISESEKQSIEIIRELKNLVENQKGIKVKSLQSNNGGVYICDEFENFLKKGHHKKINDFIQGF